MKNILLFLLFINFPNLLFTQTVKKKDLIKLKTSLDINPDKKEKINISIQIYHFYIARNSDSAIKYARKAVNLSESTNFIELKIKSTSNLGSAYYYAGENAKALTYFLKSNQFTEKLVQEKGQTKFSMQQTSKNLNNLGAIYLSQKNYFKAEIYFKKSLKIDLALKDYIAAAHCFNNIGTIKEVQNNYEEALANYFKALHYKLEAKDSVEIPSTLINIGVIKMNNKDYTEADSYFKSAIKYCINTNNNKDLSLAYINLGDSYYLQKLYENAIIYYKKGIEICKNQNYLTFLNYGYESLSLTYEKLKRYKEAYLFHQLYSETKDEIFSENNNRTINEMQTKFETSKKEKEIRILKKDRELKSIQFKINRRMLFYVLCLLALISLFLFFIIKNHKQKKVIYSEIEVKSKKLEIAYNTVEEKQREILDSINYAKRIQGAILPTDKNFKSLFPKSFIIYKPKDIVAGDFYWIEKKNDTILFAAADCTGHGVPGAMVSVICNNGLNRSVREYDLYEAGDILDKTREIVIQEFEKSEEELKDGMDISLCSLKKNVLNWSGANLPLWINRKGEIIEYKPNKQPIGRYLTSAPFESHNISLEKDDIIYLFTDGIQDQFGGPSGKVGGKKFKASKFRELLLSLTNHPMDKQQMQIEKAFDTWKGDLEQVDDVCIIGIKI